MANAAELLVSKSEFARLINVTPGRVSQMISERKIGPDALVGEGRSAKIRVDLARQQISARTDVGQRFGNGIATLLDAPAELPLPQPPPAQPKLLAPVSSSDPTTEAIKAERLRSLRMANERQAEERLADQGRYVRTNDVRANMGRLAASLVTVFESGLADLAAAIAAEHGLVQRDVLHCLRTEFRAVRVKAAEAARREVAELPSLVPDEIPDASDDAVGQA